MTEGLVRLRQGGAKYRDLAGFVAHLCPTDTFEPPTYVVIFDEAAPPAEVWGGERLEHALIDIVAHRDPSWDRPQFVALDEEGVVVRMLPGRDAVEDLAGAGLRKPGARKHGYATAIRSLGNRLHVVGYAGQCWREGPGGWEHWEEGLPAPGPKPIDPTDIALSPGGLFAVCDNMYGKLWLRRAEDPAWREVENPSREKLRRMTPDPAGGLWAAGRNGTVLRITEDGAVREVETGDCTAHFVGAAWQDGALWMASAAAIWRLGPGGRVVQVDTGLSPPLRSAGRLQSVEGALWSLGPDDVARLEDGRWTRFWCPVTAPL